MQKPVVLPDFTQKLLDWYAVNARVMPWRSDPAPYHVWLSEIMLQQTRVEAVRPYYQRFLKALPTIPALAAADEEILAKLWEGLGYYSRVRNLKKAANIVVERYGGELPESFEELKSLPGIGDYTAGAVASIAFGVPVPAVDGNVLRVLSRLTASAADIAEPATKAAFAAGLAERIPPLRPGDFNQALMELGATVCLPNGAPLCGVCPLAELCRASLEGLTRAIPVKSPKKPRRIENRTVLVLLCEDGVGLRKRGKTGLLAGLWEFPNLEGSLSAAQAKRAAGELGCQAESALELAPAKHVFTHLEWNMTGYLLPCSVKDSDLTFATLEQLEREYALPGAFRAFTNAAKAALENPLWTTIR